MIGPLILGHELSAVVESGPRAGRRVAVDPAVGCEACPWCRAGSHHLCDRVRFAGHGGEHGALRRQMVWPERCLVDLPDTISDEVGALLEPLGVALHAIDLSNVDGPASVSVVGAGPIGLLLVAALVQSGSSDVAVIEPLDHRRIAARDLGAQVDDVDHTRRESDVVFETSGTDSGLAQALESARPGGRIVVVGIPAVDETVLTASLARRKELTLIWCRRMARGDLARALAVADGMGGVLADLVSHRYALEETPEAFATLVSRRGLKVVVRPNG